MASEQRLIDANKLESKLQEHHDFFVDGVGGFRFLSHKDKARVDEITNCIAEVVNSPTVDAVEVVRCRGCRWYLPDLQVCGLHSESKETIEDGFAVGMDPDGFCSYGEIKREGGTGGA